MNLSERIRGLVSSNTISFIGTVKSVTDLNGVVAEDGTLAIDNINNIIYIFDSTNGWVQFSGGSGITSLVQDTTPELGGDLDLNGNDITGTGNILITGTVNGRDLDDDGTKLDGIETGATADQTGSEIVTLIDTELGGSTWQSGGSGSTDLAYTASTRLLASSSGNDVTLPLADGTNAGLLSNSDFTKLAGIEASADVTDDANVKAALDGMSLTNAGTPASDDKVLIQDTSDSNNLKYVQVSTLGGGSSDHGTLTGLADDDHTQYAIISTGSTAPASTPARAGAIYIDTTADNAYIAVGNSSSADWQEQVVVDGTSLANGEILIWDSANSKFIRDNRTVSTGAVTTIDMNSIMGNYYSSSTSSTSASYTLQNVLAGGRATIRISNSTSGGPTFSGSGLTVTKLGDWTTNYSTTGTNTIYLEAVTSTLIYCWITAVD